MKIEKFPLKARAKCAYCDSTVYGYVQYVDELVEGYVWFKTLEGALIMVKEDTVCAWTGKKDSNDVKIFEGDFLQTEFECEGKIDKELFLVVYNEKESCFVTINEHGKVDELGLGWLDCVDSVKVVGNVYDNEKIKKIFSELLRAEK